MLLCLIQPTKQLNSILRGIHCISCKSFKWSNWFFFKKSYFIIYLAIGGRGHSKLYFKDPRLPLAIIFILEVFSFFSHTWGCSGIEYSWLWTHGSFQVGFRGIYKVLRNGWHSCETNACEPNVLPDFLSLWLSLKIFSFGKRGTFSLKLI